VTGLLMVVMLLLLLLLLLLLPTMTGWQLFSAMNSTEYSLHGDLYKRKQKLNHLETKANNKMYMWKKKS
jgi:hypothetical protein